jgi:hypothetical protein
MSQPNVIVGGQGDRTSGAGGWDFSWTAARVVLFAGLAILIASLFDYGILWIGQRQDVLQWEFIAVTRTMEGFDNLIFSTALIYLGLYMGDRMGVWANRILCSWLLFLGLASLGLLGLTVLNYLGLRADVQPQAASLFRTSVVKTAFLALLYAGLLFPAGLLGFRSRRR